MPHPDTVSRPPLISLLGRFWTAANVLTLVRLVLAAPITWLIVVDGPMRWILALIGIAMLTDWVDGHVARWSGTVSEWGKVLDPLADKANAAFVTLAIFLRDRGEAIQHIPLWFIVLVVTRDVLIVAGSVYLARRTSHVAMSLWMGKVAVTALALTVLAALLEADPPIMRFCVVGTTALLVVSFVAYAVRFARLAGAPPANTLPPAPREPIGEAAA